MKKSIVVVFFLLVVSLVAFTQAQSPKMASEGVQSENVNVAESSTSCENLGTFLKKEILESSKSAKDNPSARIIGVQERDAFAKALNLCTKLKAKRVPTDTDELVYELPDGLGNIIIREVYEDGIYLKLKFVNDCSQLPFNEIRYVNLKQYNSR